MVVQQAFHPLSRLPTSASIPYSNTDFPNRFGIFEFSLPAQFLLLLLPLFSSSCRGEGPGRKGVQEFSLFSVEQPHEMPLWHGSTEYHSSLHCEMQGLHVISSHCGSIMDPSCFPQVTLNHHLHVLLGKVSLPILSVGLGGTDSEQGMAQASHVRGGHPVSDPEYRRSDCHTQSTMSHRGQIC